MTDLRCKEPECGSAIACVLNGHPVEPDYEAAWEVLPVRVQEMYSITRSEHMVREIVDAALGVKSDDSRCPANHWEPGLGPCICKGRVHKGVKSDES